jgi:SAM-dependent methyltransferase
MQSARNPHFDDDLIVWKDEYSGRYLPPETGYKEQFDLQWKLALEDRKYYDYRGASLDDSNIASLVHEWTGVHPDNPAEDSPRILNHSIAPELIKGKDCIDIGCGLGRWTRVMQRIGAATVLSVDASESAIKSVSMFNDNYRRVNLMELNRENPDLAGRFDFANLWGVAMCTHDPLRAFRNAAATVKPGGSMYLMVYTEGSIHQRPFTNFLRKKFYSLDSVDERLRLVEKAYDREWDPSFPFAENLKNLLRNILGRPKGGIIGMLDMLEPYYNWVVPLDTVIGWMKGAGFTKVIHMNEKEEIPCAVHALGLNKQP